MRELFETQLKTLNNDLSTMETLCVDCITLATQALLTGASEFADKAITLETEIDDKQREIETLCMKLLLKQQPVARDLKTIRNALKIITDLQRIGAQGSDIAEISKHVVISQSKNNHHIAQMADVVIAMLLNSVQAFVKDDALIAQDTILQDDKVDELFTKIRNDLVDMMCSGKIEKRKNAEEAISTLMVAKYIERIGDHIVNIAQSLIV